MIGHMSRKNIKKGFTLIELNVVLALLLVFSGMVIFTVNNLYRLRSFYDQEMVLQQNFRTAVDRITEEFRQANKNSNADYDIIIKPNDYDKSGNAMGEELIFTKYDEIEEKTYCVRYRLETSNLGNALYRIQYLIPEGFNPDEIISLDVGDPITENMKQLVKVYFIRQGGKVIITLIGKIEYFGNEHTFSYTSLIYSRNSNKQELGGKNE